MRLRPRGVPYDYFVDGILGDNGYAGTQAAPFKTIQHAADVMVAGKRCLVMPGTYAERIDSNGCAVGSDGLPITFQAMPGVTCKGFSVRTANEYWTIRGFTCTSDIDDPSHGNGVCTQAAHTVIEDNYCYYNTRGGVYVTGYPDYDKVALHQCVIRNNRLCRNQGVGMEVQGQYHLVEGNEIWDTIQHHPLRLDVPLGIDSDAIHFFGTGHVFRDNYIHDIPYDGVFNIDPHIDAFQTWGPATQMLFEKNVVVLPDAIGDYMISKIFMVEGSGGTVSNLIIRNNVFYVFRGLEMHDCPYITVQHNTFRGVSGVTDYWPAGINLVNCSNADVRDNIFYDVGAGVAGHFYADTPSLVGLNVGYNLIYRAGNAVPYGSASPNDQWRVDPAFVNAATYDYHLQAGSGAINTGVNVGVTEDLDGVARPQGAGYDIGAYEKVA